MGQLFDNVLSRIPLVDITDKFTKSEIMFLTKIGDLISLQAGFYFKDTSKRQRGINQIRKAHYKKGNIEIEFVYDAYEATSTSAWALHLTGHKTATIIGYIKSMILDNTKLKISISCLSIGTSLDKHPDKIYSFYS